MNSSDATAQGRGTKAQQDLCEERTQVDTRLMHYISLCSPFLGEGKKEQVIWGAAQEKTKKRDVCKPCPRCHPVGQ